MLVAMAVIVGAFLARRLLVVAVFVVVPMAVIVIVVVSMIVSVSMAVVMMRAIMAPVWLVNALNVVHEVTTFSAAARNVPKRKQIENIACQAHERSQKHYACVDFLIVLVQDSIRCFDCEPNDHAPDNEDTGKSAQNLRSVVAKRGRMLGSLLADPD